MAKFFVMSLRDRAAEIFNAPYCVPHPRIGLRALENEVNRPDDKNALFTNPEDFELYELGAFDDATGKFECLEQPKLLATGKELKRAVN